MKNPLKKLTAIIIDVSLSPFTLFSACCLKLIRRCGTQNMNISRKIFNRVGVFPIRDHYYEPLFNEKHLKYSLHQDRNLPSIDFNTEKQLNLLSQFNYNNEFLGIPVKKVKNDEFYYNNGSLCPGDAEYIYNITRLFKPRKIIEIGCGNSTLVFQKALQLNQKEQNEKCKHICIEPYEMPWLEKLGGIKIVRKRLEDVDIDLFKQLERNDILFIDSSHIIRPQGDVLREYLQILPILQDGVIIHVHDIFTPKDYLDDWIRKAKLFWNEQYLLEAFLSYNKSFEIIGSLNYLKHNYFKELSSKCPNLTKDQEPGSFWMRKIQQYGSINK